MGKREAPSSSSSSHGAPWAALPPELTANILQRLVMKDILHSAQVCSSWRSVCRDPSMWRFVDLDNIQIYLDKSHDWAKIYRLVVNWSQGQLISIELGSFTTDDLLLFIAQRSKQLRSICILSGRISDEAFCEAVKEFPLLEELELTHSYLSKESIKAAGLSCPLLKSFSFTNHNRYLWEPSDEEALAIAGNMHGLKHLALVGNDMTDEGLKAILDGCPHLQSLNLEYCNHVTLRGDLGKRCSQQIKNLKHSHLPNIDADFDVHYNFDVERDDDL